MLQHINTDLCVYLINIVTSTRFTLRFISTRPLFGAFVITRCRSTSTQQCWIWKQKMLCFFSVGVCLNLVSTLLGCLLSADVCPYTLRQASPQKPLAVWARLRKGEWKGRRPLCKDAARIFGWFWNLPPPDAHRWTVACIVLPEWLKGMSYDAQIFMGAFDGGCAEIRRNKNASNIVCANNCKSIKLERNTLWFMEFPHRYYENIQFNQICVRGEPTLTFSQITN